MKDKESMEEVEDSEPRNVETPATAPNGDVLPLVGANESGVGYPYAPENWPKPGDSWRWKVGSRITKRDHHVDRYLYAPKWLPKPRLFASKVSLERYIIKEFPATDINSFFAMFTWNIPARKPIGSNTDDPMDSSSSDSSSDVEDSSGSESQVAKCPAGKKFCNGLLLVDRKPTMPCDICCKKSDFCRNCSCILCKRNVRSAFGGYSYFRCEAVVNVNEAYICGHVAHLDCARKCYRAGTFGGLFDLDAAYFCRLCDAKSDLVPHAMKLLEIAKNVDSGSDLEKILKLGIFIMRGSKREPAQELCRLFETAYYKLKKGIPVERIWEAEDKLSANPQSGLSKANEDTSFVETAKQNNVMTNSPDKQVINPPILQDEINTTLQSLKRSQEAEYTLAEEKLHAKKKHLVDLQKQLIHEKSVHANHTPTKSPSAIQDDTILSRTDEIKMSRNSEL